MTRIILLSSAVLLSVIVAPPGHAQPETGSGPSSNVVIPFPDLDMMDNAPAAPQPAAPQPVTPQPAPAAPATVDDTRLAPLPLPGFEPAAQPATPPAPEPETPATPPAATVPQPSASPPQPAAASTQPVTPAPQPVAAGGLTTFPQRHSYAVGMKVGLEVRQSLDKLPCKLDIPVFLQAIEDCLRNRPTALTPETAAQMLMDDLAQKNKQEGERFLAANAQREGVRTTPSGLQYTVLRPGSGPRPGPTDRVRINYVGALLDGTVFDSTKQRGPAVYSMAGDNALLDGVAEGVRLMSTGAVYQLYVPPDLAFGDQGALRVIGPNAVLIFEIELLEIQPQ